MTVIPDLIFLSIILYFMMHVSDSAAITSVVAGKLTDNLSQGVSIHNSSVIAARLSLPLILIISAFLIENRIMTLKEYLLYAILHLIPVIFMLIYVLRNTNIFQKFFQRVIFFRNTKSLPMAILSSTFSKKNNVKLIDFQERFTFERIVFIKSFVSSLAYIFIALGFFISFSLSYHFEDYRMTISQITTVFHGVGSVILAFFIDPMLTKSIDLKSNKGIWINNIYSIMFGRLLSYIAAVLILFIYYLNVVS